MNGGIAQPAHRQPSAEDSEVCTHRCARGDRNLNVEHNDLRSERRSQRHDLSRPAKDTPNVQRDGVHSGERNVHIGASAGP